MSTPDLTASLLVSRDTPLLQVLCCRLLQPSHKRASWRLLTNFLHVIHRYDIFLESLWAVQMNECLEIFRGAFYSWTLTPEEKFWSFHWPTLILFDLFVTAFLFNTTKNKKYKIIPTLRATLISCYCQELTSISNRTENNSYQTTLIRMSIFRLWITIFASKTIKKCFVAKKAGDLDHFVS